MATIDTNMSLVMIDPNEPLELYDGTIIKGRLEWFLYALCCLDYGNLPTPLSRIEEWANALITNELPNMEPQSRAEEFFKAILTGDTSNLPTPQSRSEVLLDKLARGENDFTNVEKIQSRYEFLLAYLIKNGGGIGNIDYVLYKFQKEDEILYNTKERPVKSAILSGNTLVNLLTRFMSSVSYLDAQYRIILNNVGNFNKITVVNKNSKPIRFSYHTNNWKHYEVPANGNILVDVPEEITTYNIFPLDTLGWESANYKSATDNIVLLHGDYANQDIPYFTGMQSVKMPVLTTTGKNLVKDNRYTLDCGSGVTLNGYRNTVIAKNIKVKPNTKYVFSYGKTVNIPSNTRLKVMTLTDVVDEDIHVNVYSHKNRIKEHSLLNGEMFTTESNARYISITTGNFTTTGDILIEDIQIEQDTQATSYEPYKTNILSTPSDLELRGIGDVKDTLDCLTGEVVENTIKLRFSGIENWETSTNLTNYMTFRLAKPSNMITADSHSNASKYVCDKLQIVSSNTVGSTEIEAIWFSSGHIYIRLPKTKASSLEEFKTYLSTNNIQVVSCVKQPVVKTVDLTITDQGGATIPKLNTFDKITHVNVSATDILPGEVEMEVATTIGENLSGTLYSTMEDIETKQEALKESNNTQTESVNSTMMATTEIYESLL